MSHTRTFTHSPLHLGKDFLNERIYRRRIRNSSSVVDVPE